MSNAEEPHTFPRPPFQPSLSSKISSSLSKFEVTARELNAESDAINDTLNAVERRLASGNAGVEAWLPQPLRSEETAESTRSQQVWIERRLGFTKINGKWCLAVKGIRLRAGFFEGDTSCPYRNESLENEPIPLAQARRDERIKALEYLPELIELMNSQAKKATQTIKQSKELA